MLTCFPVLCLSVCYDRAPYYRTPLTFLLSAIWHGVYPGYYFTFISAVPITFAARAVSLAHLLLCLVTFPSVLFYFDPYRKPCFYILKHCLYCFHIQPLLQTSPRCKCLAFLECKRKQILYLHFKCPQNKDQYDSMFKFTECSCCIIPHICAVGLDFLHFLSVITDTLNTLVLSFSRFPFPLTAHVQVLHRDSYESVSDDSFISVYSQPHL